jgi:hypothetical protein
VICLLLVNVSSITLSILRCILRVLVVVQRLFCFLVNPIDIAIARPLSHCVLVNGSSSWRSRSRIIFYRLIRSDHRGVVGTGSLFNVLDVLPHFMSLAAIEPVCPSYSNRVTCSLQTVGRSSISIPQQFWPDYYCRSPSVAFFTFNSYSLITVVTLTATNLCVVDNNRFPFCCRIIYIKVLELEIKHKHGGFNINYEKATVVWQQFGFGL